MKNIKRKATIIASYILILFIFILSAKAQVTIGSAIPPCNGVLLDLKENTSESGGATTGKGLLLPRLELTNPTSLVDISGANVSIPKQYTGLIVYNISGTYVADGINVWDGTKWISFSTLFQTFEPKSFVRVRSSSNISVANVTLLTGWRKLSLPLEDFDENSEYDNTTSYEFKAKQKGIYNVYAQMKVSALAQIGDVGIGIFIKKTTDSSYTLLAEQTINVLSILSLNAFTRSVETLVKLDANDIIAFGVKTSGDITLLGDRNSYLTIFQVK